MADVLDIQEVREPISVIVDDLINLDKTLTAVTNTQLEDSVTKLMNNELLVKGQLVYIKSTDTVNVLGTIPAIVTKIIRTTATNVNYELTMLAGDLNGELVKVTFEDSKIKDAISAVIDPAEVTKIIDAIKNTKLGKADIRELLVLLGVKHIFTLDTDNVKVNSYL